MTGMSSAGARLFLLTYDIADRKRWRRAHKVVVQHGEMQQLSVYLCRLPVARLEALRRQLSGLLHPKEDRLMVADLGPAGGPCAALRLHGAPAANARPVVL